MRQATPKAIGAAQRSSVEILIDEHLVKQIKIAQVLIVFITKRRTS